MRNGNRLIAVVMGSSSSAARNANVEGLLLTGFDVLERRARGERVTVAQNLFSQSPSAYVASARAPAGQGEGDEDPIDVVLTRNTARPAVMNVSNTLAGAVAVARAAPAPARPQARNWWVQVGEFKSHGQAKAQIEDVSRRFARLFDNAEGSVAAGGRTYRARFSGFNEQAAHEACSTVKSRGMPCEVGGPV
jgi:D-alanyl-D-alanine carboxypeptidase